MLDTSPEVSSQNLLIPEVRKNSSTSPEFLVKGPSQDPAVSWKSGLARGAVEEKAPPSLYLTSLVSQRNKNSLSYTLILLPTAADRESTLDPALTWFI